MPGIIAAALPLWYPGHSRRRIREMKKRKRMGRTPTGKGHPIMVRLQPNFLKALDRWRENQRRTLSRPEAIRQLAWLGLLHQGAVGG